MKTLVTGAFGSIGFPLAKRLMLRGDFVTLIDNLSKGPMDSEFEQLISSPNVTFILGDLTNPSTLGQVDRDFDLVFHAAAMNGTANFYERSFDVLEHSTVPTILLLRHLGVDFEGRFVYFGSSEAYAGGVTRGWVALPTKESVPLVIEDITNPRWSYGASKLHGEAATVAAGASFGTDWTIMRIHNSYGPRMGSMHVIPDFISRALNGEYELFGHRDTRSFAFVDDVVNAVLCASEHTASSRKIVNVGSDEEVSVFDLAGSILEVLGVSASIKLHPSPEGSVPRRIPDLSLIKSLGWRPEVSLEVGLKITVDWMKDRYHIQKQVQD
jgi:nucleoside-diphosphate-sugar epimerase